MVHALSTQTYFQVFIYLQNMNKPYSLLCTLPILIRGGAALPHKDIANGQRTINISDKEKVNKMLNGAM